MIVSHQSVYKQVTNAIKRGIMVKNCPKLDRFNEYKIILLNGPSDRPRGWD